jgi:hypothetical protein
MTCELKAGRNSKVPSVGRKCRFWHVQLSQACRLPCRIGPVGSETARHHIQMLYDRFIVSSKPSSSECASWAWAYSCRFQYMLASLTHPVCAYFYWGSFTVLSIFPSTTWFRRQFLCNMCPVLTLFLCMIFQPSLSLCNMSSFFRDQSNWTPSLFYTSIIEG